MPFFSRFRRIIALTYGVIFFCASALFWVLYKENFEGRLSSLRLRLVDQSQALDYLLRIRYDAVNGMRIQAEDFMRTPFHFSDLSDIALKNGPDRTYFHLDVPHTHFQMVGNITGQGSLEQIPPEKWQEIRMAYSLNPLFKVIKENIKSTASLRYVSQKGFMNVYPWRAAIHERYSADLLGREAFQGALPHKNPKRDIFWTDAFLMPGSDELMQTCGAPVYHGNTFLGVVTLDFTLEAVDYFIDSIYYRNGRLLVVNDRGTVVSDTDDDNERTHLVRAASILPPELTLEQILAQEEHSLNKLKGYWVYRARTDFAPWNVIFYINAADLGLATLLHVGPSVLFVLIFGMLFLLFTNKLIGREFITPTHNLVSHIMGQGKDDVEVVYPTIQDPWKSWFEAVSSVFEQNRALVLKLEDHIHTLDARVQERTQEISKKNQELQKAIVNLRKAQQQIIVQEKLAGLGSITAGIAHEIKNPLNFIINFAQVCQEFAQEITQLLHNVVRGHISTAQKESFEELLEMLTDNLKRINLHANRADSIVKSMLTHAKGGSDEEQHTDINRLLEENVTLAIAAFRSKGTPPRVEMELAGVLEATVYRQALGRVLLNMIHNACYALQQKRNLLGTTFEPVLTLKTQDFGDSFEVQIEDNGPGMSESVQKKIFDPFFTTKPAGSGTGLGLSLSYDIIVNQHHGTLSVESQEGAFTRFIMKIPKKTFEQEDNRDLTRKA